MGSTEAPTEPPTYASITTSSNTVGNCMWMVTVILLWDSIQMKNPSRGVCVLLGAYMLMTCLLITYYFDSFTAIVTVPKYVKPPLDTLEQLWKSDMKVLSWGISRWRLRSTFRKKVENVTSRI